MSSPNVTAAQVRVSGANLISVKLQSDELELNILLDTDDVAKLLESNLPTSPDETSLKAGTSCNASVFWSQDGKKENAILLIGHDDVTWDIGYRFPIKVFRDIQSAIAAESV